MQAAQHNLSTGGTFSRLLAGICCARPGVVGLVDQFLEVDGLAGGPLDAPDVMPAGATYFQPISELIDSTVAFR